MYAVISYVRVDVGCRYLPTLQHTPGGLHRYVRRIAQGMYTVYNTVLYSTAYLGRIGTPSFRCDSPVPAGNGVVRFSKPASQPARQPRRVVLGMALLQT